MKIVSLKKSASDRKADKEADGYAAPMGSGDDEGVAVHLSHHHLEKLGLGGKIKSGHKFTIKGHGKVEESDERSRKDGERYSARLRLTHAGVDHDGGDLDHDNDKASLGKDIESAVTQMEKRGK